MTDSPKRLSDTAFAKRLDQACDQHGRVPPFNKGRQAWLAEKLDVSVETSRKWFSGEARPRPEKMAKLAEVLRADESWLSLGFVPDKGPVEKSQRNAAAPGAVNLVAGLIQLAGGAPAFFKEDDPRAAYADLLAIIRGSHHEISVPLGHVDDNKVRFTVPAGHENAFVVGVVMTGPLSFDLLGMPSNLIVKHGRKRGGYIDLQIDKARTKYWSEGDEWPRIESFEKALIQ